MVVLIIIIVSPIFDMFIQKVIEIRGFLLRLNTNLYAVIANFI